MKILYLVINIDSESTTINGDFTEYYTVAKYLKSVCREGKWEWTNNVSSAQLFNTEKEALEAMIESQPINKFNSGVEIYTTQKVYVREK